MTPFLLFNSLTLVGLLASLVLLLARPAWARTLGGTLLMFFGG